MISNLKIVGIKYTVDNNVKKYATKRIGKLDRFLPRKARRSASAEIKIKQVDRAHGNKYEVETLITVPGKVLTAKDESGNVMALIDILEVKLAAQMKRYKAEALPHTGGMRGLWRRFRRRGIK
jgi:ribosomal subunit interface protein